MLILLSVIFGIVLAIGIVLAVRGCKCRNENLTIAGTIVTTISAVSFIFSIIITTFLTADISTAYIIDNKIAMYQEENSKIEEKINTAVENYLEHEQTTLINLKPEDAMAILAAYPELSSDKLVASQVNTYISNANIIKSLKKEKIELAKKKWWLYFGN